MSLDDDTPPLHGEDWRWACDICGTMVLFPTPGTWSCPGCRLPVTVRPKPGGGWHASGVSAVPLDALVARPEGTCATAGHEHAPVAGVCDRCGDFLCGACSRFVQGRRYCPGCVTAIREQAAGVTRRKIRIGAAWTIAALLLYFAGVAFLSLIVGQD